MDTTQPTATKSSRWEMHRKQMTSKEFHAVHRDYRTVTQHGGHYVLENTDRGTALVPVEIVN